MPEAVCIILNKVIAIALGEMAILFLGVVLVKEDMNEEDKIGNRPSQNLVWALKGRLTSCHPPT